MGDYDVDKMLENLEKVIENDPYLAPHRGVMQRRVRRREQIKRELTQAADSLVDFASGHEYFGVHLRDGQWILREWAPNATRLALFGDVNGWGEGPEYGFHRLHDSGVWELILPAEKLRHGQKFRLRVFWPGGQGERIPAYATRVIQEEGSIPFDAQIWHPEEPYRWRNGRLGLHGMQAPLIYETHVGMAQEQAKVGTYKEFTDNVLPRIKKAGYNTIQLMAVQEHAYYGSFGYQVSSFFAPSSRFGSPEDLKELVDAAHGEGIRVVMDIVHSHAASNEIEGLSRFDGTLYQYFHDGPRGKHVAWDSRCFDYGKHQVLHFLLSNCRYWMDEFRFDGFRFDGVTSMLYLDHGLGKTFSSYDDYFSGNVDEDAWVYLSLANELVHDIDPGAISIAEDVSGMPGLAIPVERGGMGFDFRYAMGVPDHWIKLAKDQKDEDWSMSHLWYELNNRRHDERTISYAESHDQALVGDQTLIFRLIGPQIYWHMHTQDDHLHVERGAALHKMIRLITLATAGRGYMCFMGNEFGHPEWIDFPRQGNDWSYQHARRQWSLTDNPDLRYVQLGAFDKAMIELVKEHRVFEDPAAQLLHEHNDDKVLVFKRANLIFAFNFHPHESWTDYAVDAPRGSYRIVLSSDDPAYGGHDRVDTTHEYPTFTYEGRTVLRLYLPARTGLVLAGM